MPNSKWSRILWVLLEVALVVGLLFGGALLFLWICSTNPDANYREKKAKVDCMTLGKAAKIHFERNDHWPKNLRELAERQGDEFPLISVESLTDPWGQPYGLDIESLSPEGYPLIYSDGPPGKGKRISNWDPKGKK